MKNQINISKLFRCALIAAPLFLARNDAAAVPLTTFSFPGASGSEASLPPVSQPSGATVGNMTRGSGLSPTANAGTFSASGWTASEARDLNDYFSFAIATDPGYLLSLTRLELDERRSPTGIGQWAIYSSLDGFASALASFSVPDNASTRVDQGVALGSGFSALTGNVEFRIYGFQSENSAGTWRIDNVELEGALSRIPVLSQIPVSTPDAGSSIALLGIALGALGFVAQRRSAQPHALVR